MVRQLDSWNCGVLSLDASGNYYFQTSCSNCVTMLSCPCSFLGNFDFSSCVEFSKFQVWHRRANHSNHARYFVPNCDVPKVDGSGDEWVGEEDEEAER